MRAEGIVARMAFDVVQAADLQWDEREPMHGQAPRSQASVTDAAQLTQSRARMWRYPAHTRGRRHIDPNQEEIFVPAPFLLFGLILPALAWLAALGLVVPVLVVEDLGLRAALARAWQLARADYVHVLGSLATLAILVFVMQFMLAFLIRGAADEALETAFVLASVVISPLVFIGAALLYVDQAARVK